ncbi:ATP-dependent RNA helicase vasa-like [Adelges cooleyi]|uniref:ATP-dependent RNA helicase vasa-like n=1 Tax=Adelges cooleyi TaxID=133065 RepID=UPI0021807B70|nr:ATP-dependent RNA helicase vasa-like [Adelges cooleyi]
MFDTEDDLINSSQLSRESVNDGFVYIVPKSTYVPPEIDENDESLYATGIHSGINFEKLNEVEVKISGKDVPKGIESFDACDNMQDILMENIKKCKFHKPTPIQKHTLPIILSGRDLMAAAQTGSGKTVAFVLPILQNLLANPSKVVRDNNHSEPQVVIMAPTRELAVQIKTVVLKLARGTGISSLLCYGGTLVPHQKSQILRGCHILIATPGRLNEFIQHGFISFASVKVLVLDEADKMLDEDMKFDVDKILDHFSMPSVIKRQTIMISATLPDVIQHLAASYLNKNYLFLAVGIVSSASKDVIQDIRQVNKLKKRITLIHVLNDADRSKGTIVFVKHKWTADFLATYLCEKNFPSTSIHGDRLQEYREQSLQDFVSGKRNILVATSVAARGLDIKNVGHVINFDLPDTIEEYVHRIGRTGRVGNQGKATSFFDVDYDYMLAQPLIKILAMANQEIPHWLKTIGKEINEQKLPDECDQFGGTDIRLNFSSFNEEEDW